MAAYYWSTQFIQSTIYDSPYLQDVMGPIEVTAFGDPNPQFLWWNGVSSTVTTTRCPPEQIVHTVFSDEWQCEWCRQTNKIRETCCPHCGGPRKPLR